MQNEKNGNDRNADMTESCALQLSGIIGKYLGNVEYSVALRLDKVVVNIQDSEFVFDIDYLDQANLDELQLVLNETRERNMNIRDEIIRQLNYLCEE
jgi:hypothetical protein